MAAPATKRYCRDCASFEQLEGGDFCLNLKTYVAKVRCNSEACGYFEERRKEEKISFAEPETPVKKFSWRYFRNIIRSICGIIDNE